MLPALCRIPRDSAVRQAQREITLWTTKDGREIPLDEMTDEHIANAVRVLSLWRSRLRKKEGATPIAKDLTDAIDRFKRIMRQRRKAASREQASPVRGVKRIGLRRL